MNTLHGFSGRVILVLIVLLSLTAGSIFAQTATLRGMVTDAQTGDALPQANVLVSEFIFNPVVISASRRQEKVLDAPAAVSVVEASQIRNRHTLTPRDHLRGLPGVDIGTKGIVQSNIVVRGFNDVISSTLQTLVDSATSTCRRCATRSPT